MHLAFIGKQISEPLIISISRVVLLLFLLYYYFTALNPSLVFVKSTISKGTLLEEVHLNIYGFPMDLQQGLYTVCV